MWVALDALHVALTHAPTTLGDELGDVLSEAEFFILDRRSLRFPPVVVSVAISALALHKIANYDTL